MDLSHLQAHHEELITYMEQSGYSDTYINTFHREIQKILKKADNNTWTSYRDIYNDYEKVPHSKDFLRNKRTIIGALEQFDIHGLFLMDDVGIRCLSVDPIICWYLNSKN